MTIRIPKAHTRTLTTLVFPELSGNEGFIFADSSTEQRSQTEEWNRIRSTGAVCAVVTAQHHEHVEFDGSKDQVWLTDDRRLAELLPNTDTAYLDISGFEHHVWAPLFRVILEKYENVNVIYTEPQGYKSHPSPASPTVFDLSLRFRGVIPLPGFARLNGPEDENRSLFIPMLGFEGRRPSNIASYIDPPPHVIPIIGVPGFRLEYPAFTVACNREFLSEHGVSSEVRLAKANCPFEVLNVLDEIHRDYPHHYMYLAPVGTKPHSLAAVKFALDNPTWTELLYDNPVRKPGRTTGVGLTHVYKIKARESHV